MSNAVAVQTEKVTESLLRDYLASTTLKGLTDEQRAQFVAIATAFNLNPFKREVYATTYKNKDGSTQMSVVTGYEVYLKRAEMNPNYDGYECNIHGGFKMAQGQYGPMLVPNGEVFAECKVYRKDRKMPVQEVVYYDEFKQNNKMWKEKPRLMLRKVAIANAFRKAFPLDFGGMPYTNDELPDEMTRPQEVHAEVVEDMPAITTEQPAKNVKPKKTFMECVKELEASSGDTHILASMLARYNVSSLMDVPQDQQRLFYTNYKAALEAPPVENVQEAPVEPVNDQTEMPLPY